jgi:lysophospholipase L1-like esterase
MLQKMNPLKVLILVLCLGTLAAAQNATEKSGDFFLRDGDVYVIYGDSITNNTTYPRLLENYVLTRFPQWHVTFFNLGWGGDYASNIFRYQRDILPIKPTAFTDCMGLNDGCDQPINEKILTRYMDAYRQTIPMLRKANPEMRIALISAIPYENQPGRYCADGAYPQTLRSLAQAKQQLALEFNTSFIDLFTGYSEKVGMGKMVYPDFVLSGDGIHPNPIGHYIMGLVILKGMNAPAEIASLTLNVSGSEARATQMSRCQVKTLNVSSEGEITFERLAEALPCPIELQGEQASRFLDLVNFADEINRDTLAAKGLAGKAYELKINGVPIAIYTNSELAHGVNISKPAKGPLFDQAAAVAQATAERQCAHLTKWRTVWLKDQSNRTKGEYDLSDKARIDQLDAQAQAAIKKQHELNQPKWMTFTLTPVAEKPLVLPKPVTLSADQK